MNSLYTIGHSNHPIERFLELLNRHGITAVGDVRSHPYSQYNPQFNRENLRRSLKDHGIAYVYLGRELGPRSEDPFCYVDGRVQYDRLARTEAFRRGVERLFAGLQTYRIALLCAEKDPTTCHRMILICRVLRTESLDIVHILEDGSTETLRASEMRLLQTLKMPQLRLFESVDDLILRAYDAQARRIAYVRDDIDHEDRETGPDTMEGEAEEL